MPITEYIAAKAALEFYADHGVDIAVNDDVADKTAFVAVAPTEQTQQSSNQIGAPPPQSTLVQAAATPAPLGKTDAHIKAVEFAKAAKTLDELREAITQFDGIGLKKTATNLVFADGNPEAKIMIIGDAPAADEDRAGTPFAGASGELMDKILASIGLARGDEDPLKSAYLSNVLNWRPPGNRTPTPAEIAVSLPFIERHIQLINPALIVLCGSIPAKSLLGSGDSISRLRKKWHDYTPQNEGLANNAAPIPAIVTYHPTYLLQAPAQKRAVWHDMLTLKNKHQDIHSTT